MPKISKIPRLPERMNPMNDVIKTIMERYTCRDFTGAPIKDEHVEVLVKTALAAPSAMNLQPWHIIAITDKALVDEYAEECLTILKAGNPEFYQRIMDRGGKVMYDAPSLFIIAKDQSEAATLDCGIVVQNMALAAHSLGLGSVICGMARAVLEGPNAQAWAKRLQIPEGYSFGMSICVGEVKSGKAPHELDPSKITYIKR